MPSAFAALYARLAARGARENVPLAQYTSFRTGGAARVFFEPQDEESLCLALSLAGEAGLPCFVMGNGTNLLVSDRGVEALVLRIGSGMERIEQNGAAFTAGAGALFGTLAKRTVAAGYQGLEWAAGIPGSVGGAIAMNAGAYGGEVAQTLRCVRYLENGEIHYAEPAAGDFGYRRSAFAAPGRIVLSARFVLETDDGGAASRMAEYSARRREKQPLAYPSAGSTFKRPAGHFAGALIEQAGLKGLRVGNAEVSTQHAGFIINAGGATSAEIYALLREVQRRVHEHSGVLLEPEVKLIGSFED